MASNDIRFWQGQQDAVSYPVGGNQTFLEGEVVLLTGDGVIEEAADDPANVAGISAHRSTNAAGASFTDHVPITIYSTSREQIFRCNNFARDGAGTLVAPVVGDIATLAGFSLTAGVWSVDSGTGNLLVEIVGVLDAQGQNIGDPNLVVGTGTTVLFKFL